MKKKQGDDDPWWFLAITLMFLVFTCIGMVWSIVFVVETSNNFIEQRLSCIDENQKIEQLRFGIDEQSAIIDRYRKELCVLGVEGENACRYQARVKFYTYELLGNQSYRCQHALNGLYCVRGQAPEPLENVIIVE